MNAPPNFNGQQACAGHAALFLGKATAKASAKKRAICDRCPCLIECFTWAVEWDAYEFLAGTGPADRARIRTEYGIRLRTLLTHNYEFAPEMENAS